jgi:RNA polymerase sigma-70 factor, ECF subfamily
MSSFLLLLGGIAPARAWTGRWTARWDTYTPDSRRGRAGAWLSRVGAGPVEARRGCHFRAGPDIKRVMMVVVNPQARFDALYREHSGIVKRYVLRRFDAQSADDVVADVFVICWRRLADVPDDPLPWLLAVARNVLANRRRRDARQGALARVLGFERPLVATAPSDVRSGGEVWRALAALSARDRELLLLVAWEGLSTARAARVLGVRANTCSARLSRARRRFARALSAETQRTGVSSTEVMR